MKPLKAKKAEKKTQEGKLVICEVCKGTGLKNRFIICPNCMGEGKI